MSKADVPQIGSGMLKAIFEVLSGEFLLKGRSNSGGVVMARSLWVSMILFHTLLAVYSFLDPKSIFGFDLIEYRHLARSQFTWFGAVFGGVYAALYTRFSSQWQYLAGLYNQLMSAEDSSPRGSLSREKRSRRMLWWQAFIQDARDVHLALKPTFIGAVHALLAEEDLRVLMLAGSEVDRADFVKFEQKVVAAFGAPIEPRQSPDSVDKLDSVSTQTG